MSFSQTFRSGTLRGRVMRATAIAGTALMLHVAGGTRDEAKAGGGEFLGGLAVGVIGGAIINGMQNQKRSQQAAPRAQGGGNRAPAQRAAPAVSRDPDVRNDQDALKALGFYAGNVDGVKGAGYENAVVQYKMSKGLIGTSFLSSSERALLHEEARQAELAAYLGDPNIDPMLAPRPDHRLQAALKALGFYSGAIDGKIGSGTRRSISTYQSSQGLPATGVLLPDDTKTLIATAATAVQQRQASVQQQIAALAGQAAPATAAPVVNASLNGSPAPQAATGGENPSWLPIEPVNPSAAASRPYDVAVLIGNRNYRNDIPSVTFGHRDADAMKSVLVNKLGFNPDNIIDLRDASQGDMATVFGNKDSFKGKIWNYVDPDGRSEVFVFYSGHGVPDIKTKTPYILPVDADPSTVEINGFPLDLMYANLNKLEVKRSYVFLDACFSGGSNDKMLISSASPVYISADVKTKSSDKKLNVLAAADGDQLASWDEEKGHGLFTLYAVEGLNGAADANQDKTITGGELYQYVYDNVRRQARRLYGRDQTPVFYGDETASITQ